MVVVPPVSSIIHQEKVLACGIVKVRVAVAFTLQFALERVCEVEKLLKAHAKP